jgi:NADH dehydrogenase
VSTAKTDSEYSKTWDNVLTHFIRRLLLGMIIGLVIAASLLVVINVAFATSGNGASVAGLGGSAGILVAGALIGGSYAWLFRSMPGSHMEHLMSGLTLGIIAWVVLALNVYPGLMGRGPMWQVAIVADTFPQLMAYLLQGSLIGLIYGLAYTPLARQLEPERETTPPHLATRVVFLGGGYAGVNAAQTLERELADDSTVGIWMVSQTNYLLHTPMLSEVSASALNSQHISPPLRNFFRRVQVVHGAVVRVDLEQRIVHLVPDARSPHRELPFDHLVLTAGSVPSFLGNEEVAAEAFTFKSLEDAVLLRNQLIEMFERADFEENAEKRRRMLTFVVAGGGFAGVELIGGLNDFARGMLPYYPNIPPEELRLVLVHSRDTILPELSASLGKYAQEKLEERGIEFKLGVRVTGAEPGAVLLGDEVLPTETFVWTAGNRPSPVLETLGLPLTKQGQIKVNAGLAVSGVPGLWAAGDCAQIPDLVTGKICPPTAQHAVREGQVLGYNVAASIKGKPLKTFNFRTLGSLAALGHQLAVAEIMGYRFSGFLAWLMWRGIYLSKLPTLEKQVRVGLDWLLDIFFPPDVVQTVDFSHTRAAERFRKRRSTTAESK